MITTAEPLHELIADIAGIDRIAIDTEADSLHCYFEKLCLIQLSIPGRNELIDPLAGFSIIPFCEELARHELVIHGADYDLRLMARTGNLKALRVFDTMLAARLTGRTEFSLAALLSANFGVTLAKQSQKANWALRPLPAQMLEYAVNDTHYLLPLAQKLEEELRAMERWTWFQQSCDKAITSAAATRVKDVANAWRITGSSDLHGRAAAVLRALWNWRDTEARSGDRPSFHILHNEQLVICARAYDTGDALVPRHLSGSRRNRFVAAAESALILPETEWPQPIKRVKSRATAEQQRLFNHYKTERDRAARRLTLDPSIIAPKATLEAIAFDETLIPEKLMPWQRELLGMNTAD